MKFCPNCAKKQYTVFDYCPDCGVEMIIVWKYKCLKCGHGSGTSSKFCVCCGSPYFIGNQEPEKGGN